MTSYARSSNREVLKKEFKALKKENPSLKKMSFSDFKKHVRSLKASSGPDKAVENVEAEELLEDMFLEEGESEEDSVIE